jgi:putative sterol carrier protein
MEGEGGGQWNIAIADGTAKGAVGGLDSPDIEIKTKPVHWMDLTMGDLNPVWAITSRKVQLHGNMQLALKLSELFGADEE